MSQPHAFHDAALPLFAPLGDEDEATLAIPQPGGNPPHG